MKGSRSDLLDARAALERSVGELVGAAGALLKPLRDLAPEQRDAVVFLGLMLQDVAIARRPASRLSQAVVARFAKELDAVSPVLGQAAIARDPCIEANIAYASALAACDKDGKNEDRCIEAWGPGFQAVMCAMERIDATKGIIEQMLAARRPPKPIPWPTGSRRQ